MSVSLKLYHNPLWYNPLQFAYQTGKGVEGAKLLIHDKIYKHLQKPKSHVRLLFANFSSAFNEMQPHILIHRLSSYFNLPDQFLLLLLNFLTDRKQQVLVNGTLSDVGFRYRLPTGLRFISPSFYIVYRQLQLSQRGQLPGKILRQHSTSDSPRTTLVPCQTLLAGVTKMTSILTWTKPKSLSFSLEKMVDNLRQVQFMGTRTKLLKLTST